jgi:hypothetical protein
MADKPKFKLREEWLDTAIELMRPLFKSAGYTVPTIRVSCGWPSNRGLSCKKRTIGQAWSRAASSDNIGQIFISPWLDVKVATEQGVLSTLVHEVVHCTVGVEEGHNKVFKKCMKAVGLEGKATATIAGEKLLEACQQWSEKLGPYPHGKLDKLKGPVKKQTTRMVKCECPECGYVARVARKWLDDLGAPKCPKHGVMGYEIPEELESDEED